MANFYIKWKGEISGPFSNSEILEMLNTGKIGLLHEIREENSESWQFLKDFDISKAENAPQKKSDADMMYAAFFLGGASFLHPIIYLFAILFDGYIFFFSLSRKKTQPEWIRLAILITAVSGMAGIIFYKNIYPVLCGK